VVLGLIQVSITQKGQGLPETRKRQELQKMTTEARGV